jgi:hypothetical protein
MGNEIIRPIDPETAKAVSDVAKFGSDLVGTGRAVGAYSANVLGDLPKNLVGMLDDWVAHKRRLSLAKYDQEYRQRLRERGVDAVEPSPSILIPLLEAAVDEDREVLRDLWTRLLANAHDPNRRDNVRASLIAVLKRFDPFDAVVLQILGEVIGDPAPNPRDFVKVTTGRSEDEVMVSFANLIEFGCFSLPSSNELWKPLMAARGRLLLAAVRK